MVVREISGVYLDSNTIQHALLDVKNMHPYIHAFIHREFTDIASSG